MRDDVADLEAKRAKAREKLFERLASQKPVRVGRWTRDELYDD